MPTYSGRSSRFAQACRQQKAAVKRLTPNETEAAELVGVSPSTMHRWGDVAVEGQNMPLAAVSLHPAGLELLEQHAYTLGCTLVPIDAARNNGDVSDDLMGCVTELGRVSEQIQSALNEPRTPGRVDGGEAHDIRRAVRGLQEQLARLTCELDGIIESDG